MLSLPNDVSSRTGEILEVLDEIQSANPKSMGELRSVRIRATDAVATRRGINTQAVLDKYSRQLGLQTEQFEALVWEWRSTGDGKLRQRLDDNTASTDPAVDRQAIGLFFSGNQSGSVGAATVSPESFFTERTFSLLEGLHATPTAEFYKAHKNEFDEHLEKPFATIFSRIRDRLPEQIKQVMETESRILARIPKNDYGRGGAWDYYWGAFYTKGGKRTEDAQLWVWTNRHFFECGFYIGEYGDERRDRFDRNLKLYGERLTTLMSPRLVDLGANFGDRDVEKPVSDMATWIANRDLGSSVALRLTRQQVLAMSGKQLLETIESLFVALFPFVLLTTSDKPMSAIEAFLENRPVPPMPSVVAEAPATASQINPVYPLAECAADTNFSEELLANWVRALERKGQAVLYGPPGTGKTFVAERLARHLIGGGNGFCDLVQFHPSYAYEDFIQGIRPQRVSGGLDYPTLPGRFLQFCGRAANSNGKCVLIVDEINRANLARVFGELMYLLEYRQREIPLAGGGKFKIPANVRMIGTMNTADRSIALVDYALRRRFAFLPLYPNYDVLRRFHDRTGVRMDGLIAVLKRVNLAVDDPHYHVGISFFLRGTLASELADIWQMEIEPYLEEYFFDQRSKYEHFRWDNIKAEIGI